HGRALVVATRQTRARAVDQHLAHAARLGGSAVCRVERPAADDPQLGTHGPDRLPLRDTYPIAESLHVLLAAPAGARPSLRRPVVLLPVRRKRTLAQLLGWTAECLGAGAPGAAILRLDARV